MNKNLEISVSREQTFNEAVTPTIEGEIRNLSMASISLLQKTGNKTCAALLNNEDVDFDNREDLLEFIWCHVADKSEVIKAFLIFGANPFILKNAVYNWGLELDAATIDNYLIHILIDKENIKNAETEIVPEKGSKKN